MKNLIKDIEITQSFQALVRISHIPLQREGSLCHIRDVPVILCWFAQQSRMTADIVLKAMSSVQGRWQIP